MMKFMGEPVTQEEIDVRKRNNKVDVLIWLTLESILKLKNFYYLYSMKFKFKFMLQDILDEADKDQNGLIDYKEFFDMMQPGPGRS